MKKITLALALAAIGCTSASVMAQESPWLVRARVVDINTANKSDPVPALGLPADQINVSNKVIPEFDITYFFTPNWSSELILTYPQKHDVSVNGLGNIGTVKQLPPTLTAQYHFSPEQQISPYLGLGVNYTNFSDVNLAHGITLSSGSWGYALQGGVDYKLDKNWSLNFDVKYVEMRSNVYAGGATISNIQINPWLIGVGVGYRF